MPERVNATMRESDWLVGRFEQRRSRLRAVAYRMLGSLSEADDALQEVWLRLSRSDTSGVQELDAWLTTVVGRPPAGPDRDGCGRERPRGRGPAGRLGRVGAAGRDRDADARRTVGVRA